MLTLRLFISQKTNLPTLALVSWESNMIKLIKKSTRVCALLVSVIRLLRKIIHRLPWKVLRKSVKLEARVKVLQRKPSRHLWFKLMIECK